MFGAKVRFDEIKGAQVRFVLLVTMRTRENKPKANAEGLKM
jgi:hypothetical protein